MVQSKEDLDESIGEAVRKNRRGAYRPHTGPSGDSFEDYRGQGQSGSKPAHSEPAHELGTSQSMQETYKSGLLSRALSKLTGSTHTDPSEGLDQYADLGEMTDEEVENVPHPSDLDAEEGERPYEAAQNWIDSRLEQGQTQDVKVFLEKERESQGRKTVLGYVNEDQLATVNTQDPEGGLHRTEEISDEEAAQALEPYDPEQ